MTTPTRTTAHNEPIGRWKTVSRDDLMAALLVEQFGAYGHQPTPVEDDLIKARRRRVLNEAMEPIKTYVMPEDTEIYDMRPWTSRRAYADEMFDVIAA